MTRFRYVMLLLAILVFSSTSSMFSIKSIAETIPLDKFQYTDIKNTSIIILKNGLTPIRNIDSQGTDGLVFRAFRDNGDAHGWYVYVFSINGNIIGVARPGAGELDDVTRSNPFDSEEIIKDVELIAGTLNGAQRIFLVTAERRFGSDYTLADAVPVRIILYGLKTHVLDRLGVGSTDSVFEPIQVMTTKRCYIDARAALMATMHLPQTSPGAFSRPCTP